MVIHGLDDLWVSTFKETSTIPVSYKEPVGAVDGIANMIGYGNKYTAVLRDSSSRYTLMSLFVFYLD